MTEKDKEPRLTEEQIINVRYSKLMWKEFRRFAKAKYDVDGSFAIKKLIDRALRDREIPGVDPRIDYSGDGLVSDGNKSKRDGPAGQKKHMGFGPHARKNNEILSGDYLPLVGPTGEILPVVIHGRLSTEVIRLP